MEKAKRTNDKNSRSSANKKNNKNSKKDQIKRAKRKVIGRLIVIILFLSMMIAGILFGVRVHENGGGLQGVLLTIFGHRRSSIQDIGPMNVLLIGSDDGGLADTIMLASYNPHTQDIIMISIPRDTFVGNDKNRARATDKINAWFSARNPERIVGAVEGLLGIEIPYHIIVELDALVDLVNEIGGVWFDVPIDMRYDDGAQNLHINLTKGYQLLNGNQAEQLLRFRKSNNNGTFSYEFGMDDYGRMRVGREFIVATMRQTLRPENIFRVRGILDIMYGNAETNISLSTARNYIPFLVNFDAERISSKQLPGRSELTNGVWVFIHDRTETEEMVRELFFPTEDEEVDE